MNHNERQRQVLVTGSASGIGQATAETLASRGDRVIGVDIHDAEITADLSQPDDRERVVRRAAELTDGTLDAVVTCAGISWQNPPKIVAVNYFGTISILEGVRPLLERSAAPRAIAISSIGAAMPFDSDLRDKILTDDEPVVLEAAAGVSDPNVAYIAAKVAIAMWVRMRAAHHQWSGKGILINAVAPGIVRTGMTREYLDSEAGTQQLLEATPTPLGRPAESAELAELIAFLCSPANSFTTGQAIYCDGGAESLLRPDRW